MAVSDVNSNVIRVIVIVNDDAYGDVPNSEIQETIDLASELLVKKIGKGFSFEGYLRNNFGNESPEKIMHRALKGDGFYLPDYVIVLQNDPMALLFGGHVLGAFGLAPSESQSLSASEYCNSNGSPFSGAVIYGAVIDWDHPVGACGYEVRGGKHVRVRTHSANGECRDTKELACVETPEAPGKWLCPNLLNDPDIKEKMVDRRHFNAETIIHELLHFFGKRGNYDHMCPANTTQEAKQASGFAMCGQTVIRLRDAKPMCSKK